ncbi:MAG: radical SAM protein [Calditerrivibrio sp.]|nr:radical SAM protein [Calditerrivibrio sp.]
MEKWKVIEHYRRILKEEGIKSNTGRVKIALIYPNVYEIASQNLGFQFVYQEFNAVDGLSCERFVLDFYEDNLSIENQRFLQEFDIVAVSINYEEDVLNLIKFFDVQKIPVFVDERDNRYPPIIAGGALVFINPQILIDIVDIQLVGDFRPIFKETKELFVGYKDKESFLNELKKFSFSVYKGQKVRAKHAIDIMGEPIYSSIKSCRGEFSSSFLVEASKSCRFFCRFCTTGYNLRPYRKIDIEKIKDVVLKYSFSKNIGIVSAAFGDIPNLIDLLKWFGQQNLSISVSSLRIDALTEDVIKILKQLGVRSITLAEETASFKLKKAIGKIIDEDKLYKITETVGKVGIENLKLYYIFGLPGEDLMDVEAIVERVMNISDIFRKTQKDYFNRLGKMKVSLNVFNPKPFTPMQYFPLATKSDYDKKVKILSQLKRIPNLKYDIMPYRNAVIQTVIAKAPEDIRNFYKNYLENGYDDKIALKRYDHTYIYSSNGSFAWEQFLEYPVKKEIVEREYHKCLMHIKA